MSALKNKTKSLVLKTLINKCARSYNKQNTIVVAGTPRGGTSWVAESIAQTRGIPLLWEPLEPSHQRETFKSLNIGYDHYISPCVSLSEGTRDWKVKEYLRNAIDGKVPSLLYYQKFSNVIIDLIFFKNYLVKFIRANLLLHWFLREFQLNGILVVRHPCAVVSSQMNFAWDNALGWKEKWRPFLDAHYPHLTRIIDSISTDEEVLALDWAVVNLVPLWQPKPHPWRLVFYEELLESGTEWQKISDFLGVPLPKDLNKPSSTFKTVDSHSRGAFSPDTWQKRLNSSQIDRILGVCSEFGMDFYDDSPYPNSLSAGLN